MSATIAAVAPSWSRWPPNCCESCVGWVRSKDEYTPWVGTCNKDNSIDCSSTTDSRYRCPAFERKPNV